VPWGPSGPLSGAASLQDAQNRHCKVSSCMFYHAVRNYKPAWMLDMRTTEYLHWEKTGSQKTHSPSKALPWAVLHHHLHCTLNMPPHFLEEALKVPREHFCCCPSSALHLSTAATYKRREILGLIVNTYTSSHVWTPDGKTLLHFAHQLLRRETILYPSLDWGLPHIKDSKGLTPLEVILEQMWDSKVNVASKKLYLNYLLLFMPNPKHWEVLLGEEKFNSLVGKPPASLYFQAMQSTFQTLPPSHFPKSIQKIPIPHAVKPLPPSGKQHPTKMWQIFFHAPFFKCQIQKYPVQAAFPAADQTLV
uniref:Uncharacterized protein n=1 Tax=Varanus komodoensis TaxID=61221 RepID=A0A8D2L9K6_VARKO